MMEPGSRRPNLTIWLSLTLMLLAGVVVRAGHWHPGSGSDDSRYMNFAATIARGETLVKLDHAAVRLAFEGYLAAGMRLFGINTTVCALMGLVTFLGIGVLLFLVTASLSSDRPALLAVFLYLFLPIDIINSTAVVPDPLMAMLALAASLFYLKAVGETDRRRRFPLALASGLFLGLAASAKEPALFVGIALAIHLIATVRDKRAWLVILSAMALGAACVLLLELVGFWCWTSDPLYRFHALAEVYGREGWWDNRLNARNAAMYLILGSDSWDAFGIHFHVFFLALLAGWNRGARAMTFPLLWCGVLAIYLSVGSTSLTRYVLVPQHARYFLPVMVMGCALAGIGLWELGQMVKPTRTTLAAAATVFVLLSLWAARRQTPPGIVPVVEAMASRNAKGEPLPFVSESFVRRQALEHRRVAEKFPTIGDEDVVVDRITEQQLVDRGLLVPYVAGYRERGDIEERLENRFSSRLVAHEVLGPSWPPYDRWLGTGPAQRPVGWVWRLEAVSGER
jgi:4-amino-4-deoxy-L-arabinose transferase-like glycosyltransferase